MPAGPMPFEADAKGRMMMPAYLLSAHKTS